MSNTRGDSDDFKEPVSTREGTGGDDILPLGSVDPVYQAKAELLNAAIQEIGMGKYQVSVYVFEASSEEFAGLI